MGDYEQRGKGDPPLKSAYQGFRGLRHNEAMKTLENKALMTIYRKDLTLPYDAIEKQIIKILKTIPKEIFQIKSGQVLVHGQDRSKIKSCKLGKKDRILLCLRLRG